MESNTPLNSFGRGKYQEYHIEYVAFDVPGRHPNGGAIEQLIKTILDIR